MPSMPWTSHVKQALTHANGQTGKQCMNHVRFVKALAKSLAPKALGKAGKLTQVKEDEGSVAPGST